ncbi:MAG: hypothetical protein J7K83_03845, partial [Candidatus Aenigmarchaeota archaeon]|nr:hypothetical protein [Candidatus Aenigmarchaeota archaeon]
MPISFSKIEDAAKGIGPGELVHLSLPRFRLNFTLPFGSGTAIFYGFVLQLPKWGFDTFKYGEFLYVSPGYQPAYQLTIQQKNQIEQQIKAYAADVARAISDVELLYHDLRKYKEFLDYFEKVEKGKSLLKKAEKNKDEKLKEEALKLIKEGNVALRSVFIDQVDVHTGDVYSLNGMATRRWPTVIADFMQLDEERTKEEVKKKLPTISDAEAVVLTKKNVLFLEWKSLFFNTVKERYMNIKKLLEMRKASVEKYKEMLLPLIQKYMSYKETIPPLTNPVIKPGSKAQEIEGTSIWAWRTIPYEYEPNKPILKPKGNISLEKAGYEPDEAKKLGKTTTVELPVEPSVDYVVRQGIKVLEEEYKMHVTLEDIEKARENLYRRINKPEVKEAGWDQSPFYVFFDMNFERVSLKMPNGAQIEDITLEATPQLISQNLMLLKLIEMELIKKQYENEIFRFIGEATEVKTTDGLILLKRLDEAVKEEFPYVFGIGEKLEEA